jgi:hypothetical protein
MTRPPITPPAVTLPPSIAGFTTCPQPHCEAAIKDAVIVPGRMWHVHCVAGHCTLIRWGKRANG